MATFLDYLLVGYEVAADLFREKVPVRSPQRPTYATDSTLSEYQHTRRLIEQSVQLRKGANFPTPEDFLNSFSDKLFDAFDNGGIPYPIQPIAEAMLNAALMYYRSESFKETPSLEYAFARGPIEVARYRDELINALKKLSEPPKTLAVFIATLLQVFTDFARSLPPLAHDNDGSGDGNITIPLLDVIPDPHHAVSILLAPFNSTESIDLHLFDYLREKLEENKKKHTENSKKPDLADFSGTPVALIETFLSGTMLDRLFAHQLRFSMPEEARFAGHWLVAPPGRGKTTFLHNMVLDDIHKDAAIVLIDSKGDLIDPIKNLSSIKDRLLLIEPNPDAAIALNPLDVTHTSVVHAVSLIEYVIGGLLDAEFTARQSTLFHNVVPAIIEAIPNPTLDTFKEVMVKGLASLDKLNPHARQFFENRHTGFYSKTYEGTRKEVVWRLDYLLTNPVIRSMFSATHTRLDLGKEMDAGKVIIINNSKAILGDEGAEFFGRFFIALIARAAQQRAGMSANQKKSCYVYIDECQSVIAKDARIPVLLDECRSQRIALILAHQRTAQLTPPVLDAVANCAIRMANSDDEAKYLAPKLRMDVETLQALPRGTFGTFVRDLTPVGVQLTVSKVDLDALAKITAADLQSVRERMRMNFSAPRATPVASGPVGELRAPSETQSPPLPERVVPIAAVPDPGEPASKW